MPVPTPPRLQAVCLLPARVQAWLQLLGCGGVWVLGWELEQLQRGVGA
jgi:hypothetical protein